MARSGHQSIRSRCPTTATLTGRLRVAGLTGLILCALLRLVTAAAGVSGSDDANSALEQWLERAQGLKSWDASFVQTRYLKALAQPLQTRGRVWFASPDRFRWELGQPAQSIVLREGPNLQILSPKLRRVEEVSLTNAVAGPMRDAMTLLDTGFPRDAASFHRQFNLLSIRTNQTPSGQQLYVFRLQPKASGARRFLPEMAVEVSSSDYQLTATELQFTDGSRMRNDFTNAVLNPQINAELFRTNLDANWKRVGSANSR